MKTPLINLPLSFASQDWPLYIAPFLTDTKIPREWGPISKIFHLPYKFPVYPRPKTNSLIKPNELFDGYELMIEFNGLLDHNWNIQHRRLEKYVRKNYPIISIHGVMGATFRKNRFLDFRLFDSNKERIHKALKSQIFITKELCKKTPLLTIHLNEYKTTDSKKIDKKINDTIENLKNIKPYLEQEKVYIALENVFEYNSYHCYDSEPNVLKDILVAINSPYVKLNLDWGHANVQARNEFLKGNLSKKALATYEYKKKFIKTLKGEIIYSHIHYNDQHTDTAEIPHQANQLSAKELDKQDQHSALDKIDPESQPHFKDLLKLLLENNHIQQLCLEMIPKKAFKIIPHSAHGETIESAIKSVGILREMMRT